MDIGLNKEKSREIAMRLNRYLANLGLLFVKLHNYHWNVTGMGFFDLHEKTEKLYDAISEEFDKVAERIKMLGFMPLASMEEFLKATTLQEAKSRDINSSTIAKNIMEDFEIVLKDIREIVELAAENDDEHTILLLSDAIRFFEKNIWMMNAYLNR